MDVRCEKCQTEYELDESKLKPGGVTVKCTSCSHMFKVRRRITAVGPAVTGPPTLRNASADDLAAIAAIAAPSPPPHSAVASPPSQSESDDHNRPWLVRLDDGEILTCRELVTLQKWIASGRVDRNCEISRRGKKWKPLGGIGELSSFFEIADEAREVAGKSAPQRAPTAHPHVISRAPSAPSAPATAIPARAAPAAPAAPNAEFEDNPTEPSARPNLPAVSSSSTVSLAPGQKAAEPAFATDGNPGSMGKATAMLGATHLGTGIGPSVKGPQPAPPAAGPRTAPPSAGPRPAPPSAGPRPAPPSSGPRPGPSSSAPSAPSSSVENRGGRPTGAWASGAASVVGDGPSGPSRGNLRASSQADVHFGSSLGGSSLSDRIGDRQGEFENGAFVPTEDVIQGPSSAGRWIAIASILIILGGLAFLYFVVLAGDTDDSDSDNVATNEARDAAVAQTENDGATNNSTPIDPADVGEVLTESRKELLGDTIAGLRVAIDRIGKLPAAAQKELPVLTAKAQLMAAIAQHKLDDATGTKSAAKRKRLTTEARTLASAAEVDAISALELDPTNLVATVVRADAMRIRGKSPRQVESFLNKALKIDPNNRDAKFSKALLYVREENDRSALRDLGALASDPSDMRVHYRIARLQAAAEKWPEAQAALEVVLAAQPAHAAAKALASVVAKELAGESDEPGGDEPGGDEPGGDDPGNDPGGDDPTLSVDSYDRLLDKADKAAESGNCGVAKGLYAKALNAKPSGVAALTGLGYCYLDTGDFSSAYSKFRAALGVSSRYQDAMWGVAELYERQGNKAKAIAQFRKFIDAHSGSRRAATARKKIEKLGGSVDGSGSGDGTGSGSGSADPGTGSGAGSGGATPSGNSSGNGAGSAAESGNGSSSPKPESPPPTPKPTPAPTTP